MIKAEGRKKKLLEVVAALAGTRRAAVSVMKTRKTWQEKLEDSKDLPRVEIILERVTARWAWRQW